MSEMLTAVGFVLIVFFIGVLVGAYFGRRDLCKQFGIDWPPPLKLTPPHRAKIP